jgi:branched-subunit amino acid ABC-type transport system permease component
MIYMLDVLSAASLILLTASGLVVCYGWGRLINMAHGDLIMVGAYCCAVMTARGWPFGAAMMMSAVATGGILLVADLFVFRRLRRRDLSTLLSSWGLGIVLSEGTRLLFGPAGRFVDPPVVGLVKLRVGTLPAYQLVLIGTAAALALAYFFMRYYTLFGLSIRAFVENPLAAGSLGIDTGRGRLYLAFGGGALAGLAGALIAPIVPVTPYLGPGLAATAFTVVLMSGNRMTAMPIAVAIFLGTTRVLTQSFTDASTAASLTLVVSIIGVLCVQAVAGRE